ncbi:non-ribosomal peptide synthetase [Ophiocordyceps sinensis CO18]|uniref:Non-ribosomal peptide synthetase n=1 Tax=Ophiocordyceps sinensis (strain Co18 / CGMCC 3.14243) TaxID=911162 RepID=T5AGB9_OPHSC|nr:non-ribosomal peptide synthetase [Ophiocordyceps sinensis CO18]
MFGPVIAMTPRRIQLGTGLSVIETLQQVHSHHLDSLAHQAHSLLEMQGALDVGQSGLFNSILSFQKARNQLLMSADGHRLDERGIVDPVEYAISVNVEDSNAAISIQLDFNAGIVTSREAERVAQTLGAAVSLLVSDPWIKISDVNPLSENDVEQLWSWNGSVPASAEQCVHEMIEARAQGQPGAPAVCAWDGTLTYGELVRLATMLARRLVTQGVGAGVVVPLCFDKSMWTTVAMLGVIKAGGAFVLVDPSLPEQRLQAVIRQVNASLLLSSASHRSLGSRLCPHVVAVSPEYFAEPHHHASGPLPIVGLDSVDYVVFTSGTTGTPKGAIITHRNSASAVLHQVDGFGYSTKSRVYDFSTYSFDGSILNAFTVLVAGGCLCVPTDRERTNNLESSLNSLRANAVFLTPSLTQLLSPERLSHLEVMIIGGEVIRVKDVEPWWGRVFTIYGPSECTPVCMINPHPSSPEEAVRLGKGYGAVTWIVDAQDHNHLLPLGCTGELLLEGPLVGGGYLGNPEKTAAAFIEDPVWLVPGARGRPGRRGRLYKTGDLACYNEDGSISFVGRKDTQVKIRGQRVELGEVEHWVQMCMPEATQVAAEVIESQGQGSSPFLALFLQADSEAMEPGDPKILPIPPDVERILVEHLPSYLVPTVVFSMPLPMTTTGKINRKHLRQVGASFSVEQLAEMRTAGLGPKRQPTSETELCLQKIWARVLNIEASTIGLEDSFFRLGGDSIAAIKVVGEARKSGLALAVADIFRHPSLQDIANQGLHKVDNNLHEITPFSLLGDGFDARDISRHYGLDPATICDAYPCTPLQEGLISLTSKQSGNYITQSVLELSPSVAIEDLRRAWERVARVMPVLRTRLVQQSDTDLSLIQVVLDEQIRWIDATGLEQHLRSDREQSMELGKPLTRYAFVRDETGTPKWFAWTMHHALYDGWSMPLIIDAVFRAYQGELIVEGPRFQSFISYIKKQDDGQISNYWRQALEDCECVPFPAFPPSLQQQQLVTDSVIEHSLALPQDRRLGITTSILVRAAWALVVGRMTDLDEVVFGVTVSGRSAPVAGLDRMAAPTIATVPVRVRMRGDQTVADYLDTAQRQATEMIPFEQTGLQRIAKLCSAGQKACMFQTLLVVQPQDDGFGRGPLGTWLDGNKLQWSDTYALTLELRLCMGKIVASTSFDPRAIEPWMVWCLLRRLDFVLQQLDGADPGQTLAEIKIVNEQDLDRIWEWNSTVPSPAEQDVHQMIAERVRTQPDAPAVCAWDGELTYGQLDQLASILMGRLIDHEVGSRRMLVPLCFEKSMWTTVAILGVIKAGAGFVLLDRSLPEKRLQAIVQQVQGSLILSSQSNQDLSSRLAQKTLTLGWSFFTDLRDQASRHARPPCLSSILYTIFTSGSTGAPKGVEITHLNAASAVHHQTQLMGLTRESRFFDFASYSFDVSISNVLSALTTGGCLCVPQDEDRRTNLEHSIASLRANVLDITPTVAQLLSPARVPSVRTIIFSGEALRVTDVERWWQAGVQVCHAYGPSECTPTSTLNCGARSPQEVISIGKGAGLVTWVVSPENHGELLPPGCVGELLLEGPLVGRGYLASVDKTAAVFVEDPPWLLQGAPGRPGRRGRLYKTGDLVRYNEDGTLTFIGRKDSQIKIRGQRVELEEVEYQVHESIPEARQVVAEVITPEDEGSSTLVVFLKMGDDRQADQPEPMELRGFSISPHVEKRLAKHLPIYMIPALYLSIGELPSTPTGKTDRKRLREVGKTFFTAGAERWLGPRRRETSTAASGGAITEAEQPAYVLAQKVFSMLPSWHRGLSSTEDVAPCQGIAFDDVLLQPSGLDSINMMSLVHYVSREFGVKLSLELLMDRTTSIRTLAKSVSSLRASPGKQSPGMLPAQLSPSVDIMAEINRHDSGIAAAQRELASAEAGHDPNPASDESLTVFLTGANGFIGSQILRQLLENRQVGRVVALVRGETQDAARSRTITACLYLGTNFHSVKLQVWPGDLSLPRLGLDPTHWGLVTDGTSFDVIIHNGAEVHWGKSYATLEATNVNSTVELLRVAVAAPRMRFVYVSGGRERVAQDEQESDVARELGILYTIFTSGSTGAPKGVEITHLNAASAVHHQTQLMGLTRESRFFDFASYSFDVSISNVLSALTTGGCLCVPQDEDRRTNLEHSIASLRANVLDITPTVAQLLSPARVPSVRTIIFSGEALRVTDVERWWQAGVQVCHAYGPSECTPTSTLNCGARSPQEVISIGKGAGLVTWVVSPENHGELLPPGCVGELLLEGPLVAKEEADSCREVGNTPRTLRVAVRRSAEFLEKCGFLPRPLVKPEAALQAMLQEPFSRSGHELRSRFGLPGTPSERIPT